MNLLVASLFVVASLTVTANKSFRTEKMHPRETFQKLYRSSPSEFHEVTIAIKQNNLDRIDGMLTERSMPGSALYQQWLDSETIDELTSNQEAVTAVKSWLTANQIEIKYETKNSDYIKVSASIGSWEKLLNAKFYYWHDIHPNALKDSYYHRTEEYSVPTELQDNIDGLFLVNQPPSIYNKHSISYISEESRSDIYKTASARKLQAVSLTTPSSLNTQYGIKSNKADSTLNQAVLESLHETTSQNDLSKFQTIFDIPQQSVVVNGIKMTNECTFESCGEGNLDVQYMMAISQGPTSYFIYESGDISGDPWVDGLIAIKNTPSSQRPTVVSISYGGYEAFTSASILNQFNTVAMKLGVIGITIFVSSGDDGVSGYESRPTNKGVSWCSEDSSTTSINSATYNTWSGLNTWTGQGYFAQYPASSPYVVTVGGTMFQNGVNTSAEVNSQTAFSSSNSYVANYGISTITSGGGFSTYYTQPSWQQAAVSSYLQSNAPIQQGYNPEGRAYPDITFIATNYQIVLRGNITGEDGTSASAPFAAAIVNLVNSERKASGKGPVGFINPTLYANANKFNDITSGSNNCGSGSDVVTCCSAGFTAATGWDPVTGLGSIQYGQLYSMLSTVTSYPTTQPSSTSSPNAGGGSGGTGGCFAGEETVTMASGAVKPIKDVRLGDTILSVSSTGAHVNSEVISVPHSSNQREAEFVQIKTKSGNGVKLTRDHLIIGGASCDAELSFVKAELFVLDKLNCVSTIDGAVEVASAEFTRGQGLYTVVTLEPYIVVNGFVASPFAFNHLLPNAYYDIHRTLYKYWPSAFRALKTFEEPLGDRVTAALGLWLNWKAFVIS